MRDLYAAKGVDKIEFYVDKIEELLYILNFISFSTKRLILLYSLPHKICEESLEESVSFIKKTCLPVATILIKFGG